MYSTQFTNGNTLQFVSQAPSAPSQVHTSRSLMILGTLLVIISGSLSGYCAWVIAVGSEVMVPYFAITCALVHFILGTTSVISSKNTRNRPCLIASLVLGIVGTVVFVSATMGADIIEYTSDLFLCDECSNWKRDSCPDRCLLGRTEMIYPPILVFVILQSVVGITLASVSGCILCSCGCCYRGNNSTFIPYHINPPPSYVPFDNVQSPVNYAMSYENVQSPFNYAMSHEDAQNADNYAVSYDAPINKQNEYSYCK